MEHFSFMLQLCVKMIKIERQTELTEFALYVHTYLFPFHKIFMIIVISLLEP